jgi:hypothetical protein
VKKRVDFTQKHEVEKQESELPSKDQSQKSERKAQRKNATKTSSLRRVAVEAQRSRRLVKGRGNFRFVDPEVETKVSYVGMVYGMGSTDR